MKRIIQLSTFTFSTKHFRADVFEQTLWQTQGLLFFLQFNEANRDEKKKIVNELEELLRKSSSEEDIHVGYRSILVSLLARFCLETRDTKKAIHFLEEYTRLAEKFDGDLSQHPEILASKAFAKAFCFNESTEEVMRLYQKALKTRPTEVGWMYGLCLAKEKALRLPNQLDGDRESELEDLLRKVVSLDDQHYQARITLSKRLILKDAFEEAEYFIDEAKGIQAGSEDIGTKLEMLGALHQMKSMSKLYKDHLERAWCFVPQSRFGTGYLRMCQKLPSKAALETTEEKGQRKSYQSKKRNGEAERVFIRSTPIHPGLGLLRGGTV